MPSTDISTLSLHDALPICWLTFDEWYGSKPAFLAELDTMGQLYVCEVPKNFLCFPSLPKYRSLRSEEHTSELQSLTNLVCRLLLEKKKLFVLLPLLPSSAT